MSTRLPAGSTAAARCVTGSCGDFTLDGVKFRVVCRGNLEIGLESHTQVGLLPIISLSFPFPTHRMTPTVYGLPKTGTILRDQVSVPSKKVNVSTSNFLFNSMTQPFHESRLCWIPSSTPSPPRRVQHTFPVPPSDSSAPIPSDSVCSHDDKVSVCKNSDNQASAIATRGSSGAPLTPSLPKKCRRRRRRQARRATNQNRPPSSAAPVTPDERWANQRTGRPGATQPLLEDSDPTSRMRTAEYPHSQIVGQPLISAANENLPFHLGLESGEFPGLYKPAVPDQRQDSTARPFRVKNSGSGISSPPYLQPYTKPFSGRPARPYMTCPTREAGGALRLRSGIVYPLLLRAQRPDTNVVVDAALPEPAAVRRQELPPTVVEIGSTSQPQTPPSVRRRASRKPSRKRRRNHSAGVFRPSKHSPPQGHWCD